MCKNVKARYFIRWAKKAGLADKALLLAISEMSDGLIDADLGNGVFKKRVALPGRVREVAQGLCWLQSK